MPDDSFLQRLAERFQQDIPHSHDLGVEMIRVAADRCEVRLPFRPEFIGDSERQLLHPGVVSSLIDSACGVAVIAHIGKPAAIATLDLRVDYLRPSRPGVGLVCSAECYRLTSQIAFVRAQVWQDDPSAPVATSVSTFMVNSAGVTQALPLDMSE